MPSTSFILCSTRMTVRSPREPHDQIHHDPGLFRAHAGGRLVKQQQPRLARQRHADFERALLAMGERLARSLARDSDNPTSVQQFIGLFHQFAKPARGRHMS